MASIFTKIIQGEIPCYFIAEDEENFAFLDINPVQKGHVLVVPKLEVDHFFNLPSDRLMGLMRFAQKVANAMKSVIDCDRIGVSVIGLEVPHAHVHLIPINEINDIDFSKAKKEFTSAEMKSISDAIREKV